MPLDLSQLPREAIAEFCRRNGIRRLAIFGSALRDDFTPESDVDVLVEFEPEKRIGFLGLAGIEIELSEMLGRKIDLNTPNSLSPHFRDTVMKVARRLYDAA